MMSTVAYAKSGEQAKMRSKAGRNEAPSSGQAPMQGQLPLTLQTVSKARPQRGLRNTSTKPLQPTAQYQLPVVQPECTDGAAYVYDGSFEGLLSAVFAATAAHDRSADIVCSGELQPRLGQDLIMVDTDLNHAARIRRTLLRTYGRYAYGTVYRAALLDGPDVPIIVHRFILMALARCNPCRSCANKATCTHPCSLPRSSTILDDLGNPVVCQLMKMARATVNEWDRMRQFIRFEHCEGDVWFGRCNPRASVVPLLMHHFTERFNDQKFVIYDEVHHLSGVWDGKHASLVMADGVEPPAKSSDEAAMQTAWRTYWNHVWLQARYHPELQCQHMPKRLWRNLTEMKPEPKAARR
jgi:hypothetical protein